MSKRPTTVFACQLSFNTKTKKVVQRGLYSLDSSAGDLSLDGVIGALIAKYEEPINIKIRLFSVAPSIESIHNNPIKQEQ